MSYKPIHKKEKQKFRATRFVKHLNRFVDRHRFPDFVLTEFAINAEWKRQSFGMKALTEDEQRAISPLLDAQIWKEVTIKCMVEEMAEWWSNDWGWGYPILATIEFNRGDWIMKKALLEILHRCQNDGFDNYLRARSEDYTKYFMTKFPEIYDGKSKFVPDI